MKILLAGASGVVGRVLTPLLLNAGHEVVAVARSPQTQPLHNPNLHWRTLNVYDRESLHQLMAVERPQVVMHQLTDLKERNSAANARLRTIGTRNLVDAALAAGVHSMIAQSISWIYAPGEGAATEETALDESAEPSRRVTVDGILVHEAAIAEMPHHVTLRYGTLYGPGTWYAHGSAYADRVRTGHLGAIPAITNFLHVEDAAHAALEALNWPSGVINLVDGDPAYAGEWVPLYARELGLPPPAFEASMPDPSRPVSNRFARTLGWNPRHASWKNGLLGTNE